MWLFEFCTRHKVSIYCLLGALALALLVGLSRVSITADNRTFYSDSNSKFVDLLEFEETFAPNNNVLFAISSGDRVLESAKFRESIEWLTLAVERLPLVSRVDSLATTPYAFDEDGSLAVTPLLQYLCSDECDFSKRRVLDAPHLTNRLISEDQRSALVIATVPLARNAGEEISTQMDFVRKLVVEFRAEFPTLQIHFTGGIPMMQAFVDAATRDVATVLVLAMGVILIVLFVFLADYKLVGAVFLVAVFAILFSMGVAGWADVLVNTASSTVPLVVLTLTIASCMHLVLHFVRVFPEVGEASIAARAALSVNLVPMTLTTFTSAAGLLSLLFVESPPVRHIGILGAIGVVAGYLLSITLLPLLLAELSEIRTSTTRLILQRWLNNYSRSLEQGKLRVLPAILLVGVAATGVVRLEINDDFVSYFDKSTEFRKNSDVVADVAGGPNHIEVVFDTGKQNGVFSPVFLNSLREFAAWLRDQEIARNVVSLVDVMDEVSLALQGNIDLASEDANAQLFVAYELSLPPGQSVLDLVDVGYMKTHVSVLLGDSDSRSIQQLERDIYEWNRQESAFLDLIVTGENIPVAHLSSANIGSMVSGIFGVLVLTALGLAAFFRSPLTGLNALISISVPVLAGFGIWGLAFGEIGLATTVVIAVTLGVVIDDAIHLLYRHRIGVTELGQDSWEAVGYSVHRVGLAVIVTTAVLVGGFLALVFSDFQMNSDFGIGASLVLIVSLLFDLVILPRLMVLTAK